MHYLITGHTGFKGSWLTLWLTALGHTVSGISLDPIDNALFSEARIGELLKKDFRLDIRDLNDIKSAVKEISPDIVFHLAAQPLVRESYKNPRMTFETNAIGTLNILESVSSTPSVKAQVIVTTDKVYRNVNQVAGYIESDPLGGNDPYSASKAMADILTSSWLASFPSPPTAIVRAGNVIGGGDVSEDRLIPDLIKAFVAERSPLIRYPESVRPWQHVLDCLNGYLAISNALVQGINVGVINIGPSPENQVKVSEVVDQVAALFGSKFKWQKQDGQHPHEAGLLALDSTKATELLNWRDKLSFHESIAWTVEWYKKAFSGEDKFLITTNQIKRFISL